MNGILTQALTERRKTFLSCAFISFGCNADEGSGGEKPRDVISALPVFFFLFFSVFSHRHGSFSTAGEGRGWRPTAEGQVA